MPKPRPSEQPATSSHPDVRRSAGLQGGLELWSFGALEFEFGAWFGGLLSRCRSSAGHGRVNQPTACPPHPSLTRCFGDGATVQNTSCQPQAPLLAPRLRTTAQLKTAEASMRRMLGAAASRSARSATRLPAPWRGTRLCRADS